MQKKIIQGVTSYFTVVFIRDQVEFIRQHGYDVKVVCNEDFDSPHEGLEVFHIPFEREISLIRDLKALFQLTVHLRKESPDIIHFSTPKAGLLGMIAGFLTRIDTRIYMIRGLRLETAGGLKKRILHLSEKIACGFSTHVMVISDSMEQEVLRMKLTGREKIVRIGRGSSNGIDLEKFDPGEIDPQRLRGLKTGLGIRDGDFVLGYAGRLTADKGIYELIAAFRELSAGHPDLKLLLVGDFEEGDPVDGRTKATINSHPGVIHRPYTSGMDYYFSLMDLFILPTFREGFSNVSIEAQSMNVPVVTFDSTGAGDTVAHGRTGLITKSRDSRGLVEAIGELMTDDGKRKGMAQVSRSFIAENFDRKMMQQMLLEFYDSLAEGDENAEKIQDVQGA